ncbi:MAG TPA: hypothetical protein GXX18_09895 [Bacillales bacterium]|nr:hypothetical protein [Bacillales bacterium]
MSFKDNKNELEKQIRRMNALEFHIKKLLDFEKKVQLSLNKSEDLRLIVDEIIAEKVAFHVEKERRLQEQIVALDMRLNAIEEDYVKAQAVQATLMKQVDELTEKYDALINEKEEVNEEKTETEPNFGCLYIDKLYLDKYEQNNNFANLGIKELNGVLNIGATYGSVGVPKEIGNEVKEQIAKLKAEKEKAEAEVEDHSTETGAEPPDVDKEDDNDIPFTDITIE